MKTLFYTKIVGCAILFACLFAQPFSGLAQISVNTTGGEATGSGGTVSYSVGQLFFSSHFGATGSVTQGVQQPYVIESVTGMDEANGIILSALAYPNPVVDYLILQINNFDLMGLRYLLYDMNGRLLQSQLIVADQTNISMGNLASGAYFLKVVQKNQEVKTFKIIKN